MGKKSGLATIATKLREMRLQADQPKQRLMLEMVKETSIRKKGLIDEEEFMRIAKTVLNK